MLQSSWHQKAGKATKREQILPIPASRPRTSQIIVPHLLTLQHRPPHPLSASVLHGNLCPPLPSSPARPAERNHHHQHRTATCKLQMQLQLQNPPPPTATAASTYELTSGLQRSAVQCSAACQSFTNTHPPLPPPACLSWARGHTHTHTETQTDAAAAAGVTCAGLVEPDGPRGRRRRAEPEGGDGQSLPAERGRGELESEARTI